MSMLKKYQLWILAFVTISQTALFGQDTLDNKVRRITFGIETSGGLVFSSGSSGAAWGRTWLVDLAANARFPIGTDNTSLYIGIQRTSFGKDVVTNKEVRGAFLLPSGDIAREWNTISSSMTLNGGIETNIGWLTSRSTIGFGVLTGTNIVTSVNGRFTDYTTIAIRLRQQFHRESGQIMYGLKFEQTLSQYDKFFGAGIVLGIRF